MLFWSKNHKESLAKQLKLKSVSNLERVGQKKASIFLKSMMTDCVATFGVKDVRLHKIRKTSCE